MSCAEQIISLQLRFGGIYFKDKQLFFDLLLDLPGILVLMKGSEPTGERLAADAGDCPHRLPCVHAGAF